MNACDVVIAGGGPAGSACAWMLRRAGLDVIVIDRASFPRDKVCAGWVTPQAFSALELDPDEYRRTGRVIQPIKGFRVGTVGCRRDVRIEYPDAVSYGIRRCEFDDYLLRRSCARLLLGTPVATIRRNGGAWIVNDAIEAPMLVGAGGHFCPVARMLNPREGDDVSRIVAAQEVEFAVPSSDAASFTTMPETPELYFCADLKGYGWCFRKGSYLNVGFGRLDRTRLPAATADFVAFLAANGVVPDQRSWPWRGHAYRLNSPVRQIVADGVVLIGDAAGLAYEQSGEGIRPAIESGLMAAATILEARQNYARARLERYPARVRERFGVPASARALSRIPPQGIAWLGRQLLRAPIFVRRVVLDRWFLRAGDPALIQPYASNRPAA